MICDKYRGKNTGPQCVKKEWSCTYTLCTRINVMLTNNLTSSHTILTSPRLNIRLVTKTWQYGPLHSLIFSSTWRWIVSCLRYFLWTSSEGNISYWYILSAVIFRTVLSHYVTCQIWESAHTVERGKMNWARILQFWRKNIQKFNIT
jgi:hypothetical protein